MNRWYVVHTQPRAEDRALWHLRNQGFRCFLPRCRKTRRQARTTHVALEPLFPRYLFTCFDADLSRWRAINGTRGVVALLSQGTRPLPIADEIIEALMAGTDTDGATSLTALGVFCKGRVVRITAGAFAGQTGKVAEVLAKGRDRVRVLLNVLGADTELHVPAYALETT